MSKLIPLPPYPKAEEDEDWEELDLGRHGAAVSAHYAAVAAAASPPPERLQERIIRFTADEADLKTFYQVSFSPTRISALLKFYENELAELNGLPFSSYGQEDKVDYLLLKQYIGRQLRRLDLQRARTAAIILILPFAESLILVLEARQNMSASELSPKLLAQKFHESTGHIRKTHEAIKNGRVRWDKMAGYRAVGALRELRGHLEELRRFFARYDPSFDWWVTAPYTALTKALDELIPVVETELAGINPGDKDEIVGDAIGRDGLLAELEAEVIPYAPEDLLAIARRKYAWCVAEAKKASRALGFGEDWKAGLEHVKNMYLEPGEQPAFIKQLVDEGAEYVKSRDLVTVPAVAEQTWRMFMMSPENQKVNPFFLGGPEIIVSYPTADMSHSEKLMSMRGTTSRCRGRLRSTR